MVKGPLPPHPSPQTPSQPQSRPQPAPRAPLMVAVMATLAALCVGGAAITAGQLWPAPAALIYAGWMLAGAALFAAIATGLHLLHRIAAALETRRG